MYANGFVAIGSANNTKYTYRGTNGLIAFVAIGSAKRQFCGRRRRQLCAWAQKASDSLHFGAVNTYCFFNSN